MKTKSTVVVLLLALIFSACDEHFFDRKITIKGKISASSKIQTARVRSEQQTYTLADARKALIFYGNEYNLVTIGSDGTFSGKAPVGSATVVAFLTSDNQFIGNLFVGGMNVLPLVGVADDLTTIDLSTLTLVGNRVIPAKDPVGNEINLSGEELTFMQQVSTYYESLAKNIDMDGNGNPDIIDGNMVLPNSLVYVTVGRFGQDMRAPALLDKSQFRIDYSMRIEGKKSLYNSNFSPELTGPAEAPYSNIKSQVNSAPDCFIAMFNRSDFTLPQGVKNTYLAFQDGVYTFKLSGDHSYTFTHINVDMGNSMVIVLPTFHTNNGYITEVSYEYKLVDGTVIDPRKLLSSYVRIQLNSAQYNQLYEGYHLYGAYNLEGYDYYTEKINTRVKMSDVNGVGLAYIDLLGNEYQINWTAN